MHRVKTTLHHRLCLSRTCFGVVLSCSTSMSNSSNANVRVAIDVFQYRLHFSCCRRGLMRTRMSPASRSGASSSSSDAVTLVASRKHQMSTKKCEKCPDGSPTRTRRHVSTRAMASDELWTTVTRKGGRAIGARAGRASTCRCIRDAVEMKRRCSGDATEIQRPPPRHSRPRCRKR